MTSNCFSIQSKSLKLQTLEDVQPFLKQISEISSLQEVILSGNTISVQVAEALSSELSKHSDIKKIVFSDLFTGRLRSEIPSCLDAFALAFKGMKKLDFIDFSDNAFGPDCIRSLSPLISECTSLETIKLNNTGLGPEGGKILAQALSNASKNNNNQGNLRVLVCGRSRLENGSMIELGEALSKHPNLSELYLKQDGIRPEGIAVLLQHLEKCQHLQVLDLQDNTFTTKGAVALSKVISKWKNLRVLNIGDCMLEKEGCLALLKSIKDIIESGGLKSLEVLNMEYCEMDERGALLLAEFVGKMEKLKTLELNGNFFAEDCAGADAIRNALEEVEKDDVLGSLSEMEEEEDDDDEEDEDEENEDDQLASKMQKINV